MTKLIGCLSNEASQDSEGNPVYVFLDETKSGYDAWVTPKVGDVLVVCDQDVEYRYTLHVPLKERNFSKFSPPIRSYWFDKQYRAELHHEDEEVAPPVQTGMSSMQRNFGTWGFAPKALSLIAKERGRQVYEHGGDEHDDQHSALDWVVYVNRQIGKLAYLPAQGVHHAQLKVFTKIAAVAIAAMESIIRKHNL